MIIGIFEIRKYKKSDYVIHIPIGCKSVLLPQSLQRPVGSSCALDGGDASTDAAKTPSEAEREAGPPGHFHIAESDRRPSAAAS